MRKSRILQYTALFFSLMGFFSISGDSQQSVLNPNTLVIVQASQPQTLDPHLTGGLLDLRVLRQIYGSLIQHAGPNINSFIPDIAEEVPSVANGGISQDGLTYTFKIHDGVFFASGDKLEPEDVEYSFERFLVMNGPFFASVAEGFFPGENIPSLRTGTGGVVETVGGKPLSVAIDELFTVEENMFKIHLRQPLSNLLQQLFIILIVNKSYVVGLGGWPGFTGDLETDMANIEAYSDLSQEESVLANATDGSGAYNLASWDKAEGVVLLKRNDLFIAPSQEWEELFHHSGPAKLENVLFKAVPENSARELALQQGTADIASISPRSREPIIRYLPNIRVIDNLANMRIQSLAFNFHVRGSENGTAVGIGSGKLDGNGIPVDFFQDPYVREGFAKAVDIDLFILSVLLGKGRKLASPVLPEMPFHNPDEIATSYDIAAARVAFERAWGGEVWELGFRLSCVYIEGAEEHRIACEMVKQNVESINPGKFKVDLQPMPFPIWLAGVFSGNLALYASGFTLGIADPHLALSIWMLSDRWNGLFQSVNELPDWSEGGNVGFPDGTAFEYDNWDELITFAFNESNPEIQEVLYYEAQRVFAESHRLMFMFNEFEFHAQRTWVNNWYYNMAMGPLYYAVDKRVDGVPNCHLLREIGGTTSDGSC